MRGYAVAAVDGQLGDFILTCAERHQWRVDKVVVYDEARRYGTVKPQDFPCQECARLARAASRLVVAEDVLRIEGHAE